MFSSSKSSKCTAPIIRIGTTNLSYIHTRNPISKSTRSISSSISSPISSYNSCYTPSSSSSPISRSFIRLIQQQRNTFSTFNLLRSSGISNSISSISSQNEASTILPDEYFQKEVYKAHNDRKVVQLGSDVLALKREIFLDTIEKDLLQLNKVHDVERIKTILEEFIPKRGITSYGLLHALRSLRDSGQSHLGLQYIYRMKEMGAPPSLRNLPIVTEIVKTCIASGNQEAIIEAITDYATIFPNDKPLWISIFEYASSKSSKSPNASNTSNISNASKHTFKNLENDLENFQDSLYIELSNIFDRYHSQLSNSNALKIKMIRFFEKYGDFTRAEMIRKSIETSSKFSEDKELFHAMLDFVEANDFTRAHSLFTRTLFHSGGKFNYHLNTVTLALQCAIKLEDWNMARNYLHWFFPKNFGDNTHQRLPKKYSNNFEDKPPKVNHLELDSHVIESGITILSKFDIQAASSLFHQYPANTFTLGAYLNALLQTNNMDKFHEIIKTFKKYFKPYANEGFSPNQTHIDPFIQAMTQLQKNEKHEKHEKYDNYAIEIENIYKIYFSNIHDSFYLGRPIDSIVEALFKSFLPRIEESQIIREYVIHLLSNFILKFDYKKKSIIQSIKKEYLTTLIQMIEEVVNEFPNSEILSKKYEYILAQAAIRENKLLQLIDTTNEGQKIDVLLYGCCHEMDIPSLNLILEKMALKKLTCSYQTVVAVVTCYVKKEQYEDALNTIIKIQEMGIDISLLKGKSKEDLLQLLRTIKRFTNSHLQKQVQSIIIGLSL